MVEAFNAIANCICSSSSDRGAAIDSPSVTRSLRAPPRAPFLLDEGSALVLASVSAGN
jgi:hypothetical protein